MNKPPKYFDSIRSSAARRWEQLEDDPDLAGPWHQLFKQVQSPRHVLSELLQNADDAGATEATVNIEKNCFIFSHNGEDFAEEHFASLCRFGFSNKRALHTIGFRGIGFKSCFSLGNSVFLSTPTLSIVFNRDRFTEPKWVNNPLPGRVLTEIRVPINDPHREKEVEKNLQDWLRSPVSLLFFKHIRSLKIADQNMRWEKKGGGPVPETEWMTLGDRPDELFLLARSVAEPFPAEALSEIRQERLLSADKEDDFPPCKVEIVLGASGRLYVVLPTGVETTLPFACNAPFIQDPARLKIKDPETSPTNRWLLERVGELAASVMLQWLSDETASLDERSQAYRLFPDVDRDDSSLEGACATKVEESFDTALAEENFLLTDEGELKSSGEVTIYPQQLLKIWHAKQVAIKFDSQARPALSRHVMEEDCEKLKRWGVVNIVSRDTVLAALQTENVPKPESWRRLMKLWEYVAPEVTGWRSSLARPKLRILPVQGKDVLYSASEIVRLGAKRLLQSDEDWEFLSSCLLVLNHNWPRYITEQLKRDHTSENDDIGQSADAAQAVLKSLGLEDSSDVNKVIELVASNIFTQKPVLISDCVRLAQIAAKLAVSVGPSFRFVTGNKHLRSRDHVVLFDQDGSLEPLLPENWVGDHLLHPDYAAAFTSCSAEDWRRWIFSGRSGLLEFPPLKQKRTEFYGRSRIEAELRARGVLSAPSYHFKTSSFTIEDWDFDDTVWECWATAAREDNRVWQRVLTRILAQQESVWSPASSARAVQVATTGNTRSITYDDLLPDWILKLRSLPCLPDTRGVLRKPDELLLWTPETVPFIDVEPFIDKSLDRETTRPLLILLGVRHTPTGPERLLDCLRALAQSRDPPTYEVEKWYRRLDQLADGCSTGQLSEVKKAFREEKIVLTNGGFWTNAAGVYLVSDEEDVPDAAVIRTSVQDLVLWRKLGISERPTADLAVQWLNSLPVGQTLSQDEARRVLALIRRHPGRIWRECGHWLNLAREWVPVAAIEYALTMQTLTEYSDLHEWVKQKTADLRLSAELTELPPFADIPRLSNQIEERFHQNPLFPGMSERKPWLERIGSELSRIKLDDDVETRRIRELAIKLTDTEWRSSPTLEVIPYLDDAPAGTPRRAEVVWQDRVLYVERLPVAKLARLVPDRLGKIFGRADITAALHYCFGRSVDEVTEYIEENFMLEPRPEAESVKGEAELPERPLPIAEAAGPKGDDSVTEIESGDVETSGESVAPDTGGPESEVSDEPLEVEIWGGEAAPSRDRLPSKPAKPSLIERFAMSRAFKKEGDGRFAHADGSRIIKALDDPFPWELRTASGNLVRHYWPKDHCLELLPLQIEADVWGLVKKSPDTYSLILLTPQGEPIEVSGTQLCAMLAKETLVLYPASYRLVRKDEGLP